MCVFSYYLHLSILGLLIANNYNTIVWLWNLVLIFMVILLFWQNKESIWQPLIDWKKYSKTSRLAQVLTLSAILLPALSFVDLWDMYLSGALYSGNTVESVIHINKDFFEKLPLTAQKQVFKIKNGEQMLPLLEWSIAELNVPPYPESRVFKNLTFKVCKLAENNDKIELIMKERPTIFDGSYKVTRISCPQLLEKQAR